MYTIKKVSLVSDVPPDCAHECKHLAAMSERSEFKNGAGPHLGQVADAVHRKQKLRSGIELCETRWRFTDGRCVSAVAFHPFEPLFPADSGFEVIRWKFDDMGTCIIERYPVLAWVPVPTSTMDHFAPVYDAKCLDDLDSSLEDIAVIHPDGRTFRRGEWYASEAEFLSYAKKWWLEAEEIFGPSRSPEQIN